jgi:hypothetical protein
MRLEVRAATTYPRPLKLYHPSTNAATKDALEEYVPVMVSIAVSKHTALLHQNKAVTPRPASDDKSVWHLIERIIYVGVARPLFVIPK